jgi:HEAT repeat protein
MSHVFICYHHGDGDFAEILRSKIEAAGFATWMDDRLRVGEDWRQKIEQAIKGAFALIVVITPEAEASEYVTYEWACALGAGVKVIPVLLKPTECHPRLEALQYLDFSNHRARPWEKLIEVLQEAAGVYASHTIRVPKDAPPAIKRAVEALDSLNPDERKAAIENLGQMNHPAAREALAGAVQHPVRDVRVSAAFMLEQFKDARAVPGLIEILYDKDERMRQTAIGALGRIGTPAVPALLDILRDKEQTVRQAAVVALGQIGSDALPYVVELMRDKNPSVREPAAEVLGRIQNPSAIPSLLDALRDEDRRVRLSAAWALGQIKSPEVVPALREALHDNSSFA